MVNCLNDILNILAKYINLFEGKISNNNRDMSNLANTVDYFLVKFMPIWKYKVFFFS